MAGAFATMEAFTGLPSEDNSGSALTPISYIIQQVGPGENPLEVTGVPQREGQLTMFGKVFTCDRVDTPQQINESSYRVQAWFSTDGRYEWEVLTRADTRNFSYSYKKVLVKAPYFTKGKFNRPNPDGSNTLIPWYFRKEVELPLEWTVLSTIVEVDTPNDNQILATIALAESQIGHLHIFPYNPSKKWVMLPFELQREGKKCKIKYSWESDPGNGTIYIPGLNTEEPVFPPRRPPFNVYCEAQGLNGSITPRILLGDIFPLSVPDENGNQIPNPYYTPNGYQILPGGPI